VSSCRTSVSRTAVAIYRIGRVDESGALCGVRIVTRSRWSTLPIMPNCSPRGPDKELVYCLVLVGGTKGGMMLDSFTIQDLRQLKGDGRHAYQAMSAGV
jgi:hypothetical protein